MAKRILVPVVDRGIDEAVLPLVQALARDAGSTVRLLKVFPVPERVEGTHGRTVAYVDQEMERLTHEGLDELGEVQVLLHDVPVERAVRFGEPVPEILTEADAFHADLIAMAAPRTTRVRAALAPADAERVWRRAEVPVVLLRAS